MSGAHHHDSYSNTEEWVENFYFQYVKESDSCVLSRIDRSTGNTLLEIQSRSEVNGLAWMVVVLV